ncbi:paraneoplastic antigen Ma1 homolog [Pseudophryne corroboree]|uniref:paraneoplastic antigen Ma1 homolog n=1 Tax=Pseudophryne corroboree TaxID=495146 RepID=UPI00308190F6
MAVTRKEDIFHWCREKDINVESSFGLIGNFTDASEDSILNSVKFLYGVSDPCIVDKLKGLNGNITAVLINNKNLLDPVLLPSMVVVEGVPGWKVHVVWPAGQSSETGTDIPCGDFGIGEPNLLVTGDTVMPPVADNEVPHQREEAHESQVETVVGKMVSHLERWHFEGGYRRLRIFSGINPIPAGEETYELWREAATQHSEEWQCPDHVKRQRVVESLRGPAMGVIQATRRSNTNATLKDYLEALDFSFGTMEDVGDLLARLNHTYQDMGETLTHYVYRVDRLIYKIVDKGGIDKDTVDSRRLIQVLKGALTNNPVAQRLRCTMSATRAPSLNELIREVKLEEVQIENREKSFKKVKVVIPAKESPSMDERLLKLMEEQNKKLEQLIALQTVNTYNPVPIPGLDRGGRARRENRRPIICYSCGQAGHRSFECPINGNGNWRNRSNSNSQRIDVPLENSNGSAVNPSQAPQ